MSGEALELIRRSMDEQIARASHPEDFPILKNVPASRYVDLDFAATENKYLWRKTWLFAGVESALPQVGSYFLFEQLGLSVIVSRDKQGLIRAFHNSCRHRGSAILTEPKGKTSRFICPYHSWGYELSGKLASVPSAHDFPCLDKADRGLMPVRCETWRGLIFINIDEQAGLLKDFLAPIAPDTEGFPLEGLIEKDRIVFDMDCNWKLAYHNFLEIYHVNTVHPTSLAPYFDSPSYFISLLGNGHSRLATRKRKGSSIYQSEAPAPAGTSELFKQLMIALPVFPNCFIALDPSGFMIQTFWPNGVDKSIMDIQVVGWESSPTEEGYWSGVRDRIFEVLMEDKHLFYTLQRSVEGGFVSDIVMGYQERAVYWFEEEVDRRIGVDKIPEDMRVAQLLAGQVAH